MIDSTVTIQGRLVALRPISREDYPTLFRWRSSIEIVHMLNFRRRISTYEEFVAELEQQLLPSSILLLIKETKTGSPIGFALAYSIDPWDGWLWVGMYVGKEYRLKGHGGEASLRAVDALFRWFPIRKMFTEVYDFADSLLSLVRSMGFEEEGYHPDHYWNEDRFWGLYRMSLTRERWRQKRDDFAVILGVQQEFERLTSSDRADAQVHHGN